jgi:hypothetical protein
MANAPRNNVEIFVQQIDPADSLLQQYYSQCKNLSSNALPYINEEKQGVYAGLIHEYDDVSIRELQPGGRYRDEFNQKFQRIADANNCNIIVWVSENKYCDVRASVFLEGIKTLLRKDKFKNNKKTVVVLVACNSLATAVQLNTQQSGNARVFPLSAHKGQNPFFIGFNGQVHPYKAELFLCKNYLIDEEFPTRVCKTEKGGVQAMQNVLSGRIANTELTDREKCCKAMVKEYPVHFAEAFKGQRDCIKIGWEQMNARIANLISKEELTREDMTIRAYNSAGEYDGIYCRKRPGHDNDCEIDGNIVNNATRANAQRYLNRFSDFEKTWGELLFDLENNDGAHFRELFDSIPWDSMSAERKIELINTRSARRGSVLNILMNTNMPIDRKQALLTELLEKGASTNSQIPRTTIYSRPASFATQILDEDNSLIAKYLLLNTNVNMLEDEAMMAKRTQAGGQQSETDVKFKRIMEEIIKELKDIPPKTTKDQIRAFFSSIDPYLLTMVDGFPEYRRPATAARTLAGDYRVLEYLRNVSANTGLSGYQTIKNQMEALRQEAERARRAATRNATGGRRGKQRKATRKQHKNRKSKTRKQ